MKSLFPILLVNLFTVPGFLAAQPVDNPVETRYGSGLYTWSSQIQWTQTVSILDHGGVADGITPNDAAFVQARDALVALGGGVLYFPSGTYAFADSIRLVDQVVIRGDTPAVADATDPDFRPPTKLTFPKFNFVASGSGTDPDTAFKGIGMSGAGINTGLVNLDVSRASIFAGGYGYSSENVVIFGVRSNNVASEQPWTVPTPEQEDWQIHPNRFVANISAFARRNVLVANCLVNDAHYWLHRQDDGKSLTGAPADLGSLEIDDFAQPGYLISEEVEDENGDDTIEWKTLEAISGSPYVFSYTDHYGINVQGYTGKWGAPPWEQPNLFYSGAVIRDNWVYTTMRVKIDSSGRGLVIKDNILKDRSGKTRYFDPNGTKRVSNSATLENRGIDWRGHDVLIEGNQIEVSRHLLNGGPYSSVDGEAILHQEVHGSTIDGLIVRNNTANAYIGIWKMPYTRNVLIEDNTLTGPGYIIVESDTNGNDFPMFNVVVQNNDVGNQGIYIRADYYSPGVLSADVRNNLLNGTLEIEDHGVESGNTKLDGSTPATVSIKTGAVAIDKPAEGIFFADKDPYEAPSGDIVNFEVLVTTPSVNVERVKFYRHTTLMHTDSEPPYTYEYTSIGSRALWSAEIEQAQQTGGLDLYAALLIDPDPAYASPPAIAVTGPAPAGTYVAPATLNLEATVTPGANAVDRVEFYSGGTYLGEGAAGSPEYTLSWSDLPLGMYSVTAKVWDSTGAVVVSDPVLYEVSGPPDAAPGGLSAIAYSDTEIDLAWTDNASNSSGFDIERSPAGADTWTLVDSVDVLTLSYRDTGLSADTSFDYRIIATNVYGSSDPSDTATASTFPSGSTVPSPPIGLMARALNTSGLTFEWAPGSGVSFGFEVESAADPAGPWTTLGSFAGSDTSTQVIGLSAGERVYFRVRTWNNIGNSAWAMTSGITLESADALADTFSPGGLPWPIPGRIEFADYNPGGYYDTTSGNEGSGTYRSGDSVDIGGGSNPTIGWIANGEWLEFSVRVEQAGLYDVLIRFASPNTSGSLSLKFDGVNIAPAVTFSNTGGWGNYQTHTINDVFLAGGHYTLRSYVENSGFNLDYVEFALVEAASYTNWSAALLSGNPLSGATENADGDAFTNEFDMLFGLDPLVADTPSVRPDIDSGNGSLVFPMAKGMDTVSWALHYSHDLGASSGWSTVTEDQLHVLVEDPTLIWMQADVPMGSEAGIFFQFEILP